MKSIILAILFTFSLVPAVNAEPKTLHDLGIKGIELTHDMQYAEALKIFDEMIRMEPDNPMEYFFKSACYFSMYTDEKKYVKKFKDATDKAIDIAKSMLHRNPNDIDALFYLGCAYGKLGMYHVDNSHYLRAYWYGSKGIKYLNKVVEKDPEYYDAYLGLGIYNYSVSVLPNIIKSLSFLLSVHGDREKGLDEIKLSSSRGVYAKDDAKIALINIYIDYENDFEVAVKLLKEMIAKYPDNPINKETLAKCYRKLKKHDLSIQILKAALKSKSINEFPFMRRRLYYDLGKTYSEMNEYDQAILAYKNALEISQSEKGKSLSMKSRSLFYIGDSYEMMGSAEKAREYYSRIKRNENKAAYRNARARIKKPLTPVQIKFKEGINYYSCGKFSQAYTIFNELLDSELKNNHADKSFEAELYYNLGRTEYELKKYQASIQTLQKVLALRHVRADWIKPWAHFYLGQNYRDTGEVENAKHEYDIAYRFDDKALILAIDKARKEMK